MRYRQKRGGSIARWLLLLGVGALLVMQIIGELPALRRYWNMERM